MPTCCGQGLVCYGKDEWWADCRATCDPAMGWDCTELSGRTDIRVEGTWPDEECTLTHLCNYQGFRCVMKDNFTAYCKDEVPEDWNGTVIGTTISERAAVPARHGQHVGSSLFCFMAVLPGSYEEGLRAVAEKMKAGIFSCDQSVVLESSPRETVRIDGLELFANTEVFIEIWQQFQEFRDWEQYDWTIKADPDCVFWATRLRWHLEQLRAPQDEPIYVRTAEEKYGMAGALEAVTQDGVRALLGGLGDCARTTSRRVPRENRFLKGCLDATGVGYMTDTFILEPPGRAGPCSDGIAVAFHPHKTPAEWSQCYKNVVVP